jgi:hypothetical protein
MFLLEPVPGRGGGVDVEGVAGGSPVERRLVVADASDRAAEVEDREGCQR